MWEGESTMRKLPLEFAAENVSEDPKAGKVG